MLDFSGPALVMAIINCNEDSFYAPSRALGEEAVEKALAAEREGAAIVDFGAESSRPGACYISEEEELERLIPVISAFRKRSSLPVSVDTRKAAVACAAIDTGADIINDISALSDDPQMAAVCAEKGAAVVLMHKKGVPLTMQENPGYKNLVEEISVFFKEAVERALTAGISAEKIILDPGIGFGKGLKDNLQIIRLLAEICGKDYPILVGLSRKSFIGEIISCGVVRHAAAHGAEDRLAGTLAANAAAILAGADIIRVHDVREHIDLARVLFSLWQESNNGMVSEF
jgi:dihydropteroate synthase